jgi:hypothetical protein
LGNGNPPTWRGGCRSFNLYEDLLEGLGLAAPPSAVVTARRAGAAGIGVAVVMRRMDGNPDHCSDPRTMIL